MIIRKLIQAADQFTILLVILCFAGPLFAWLSGRLRRKGGSSKWQSIFAIFAWLGAIPGLLIVFYAAYISFFTEDNLPDVRPHCFVLPGLATALAVFILLKNRGRGPTSLPEKPREKPSQAPHPQ